MNDYTLKDKIRINKDFLNELTARSWQEIEQLQSQISNIEIVTEQDKIVVQLLNSLLTNYYIFVGGIENLNSNDDANNEIIVNNQSKKSDIVIPRNIDSFEDAFTADLTSTVPKVQISDSTEIGYEPFEYFVDFDEPIGEKITDEELYGN